MIKPLSLIITASAVLINPLSAVAEIDPELHKLCIDAKDYKGCIEARTEPSPEVESNENEAEVREPSTYNYEKDSVRQLKIRGKYGRYITFIGRTANTYSGTSGSYSPGSRGTLNCSTYGSSTYATTNCYRTGYAAPSYTPGRPGGTQYQRFRYELDCQDQTYNIKGDLSSAGGFKKGWMHVSNDPVASVVSRKYCPIIDNLPFNQTLKEAAIRKANSKCDYVLYRYGCSYNKYLEARPVVKAWAEANPEKANKERRRLKSID